MPTIAETYERLHPASARLNQEARGVFPDGATHDNRFYGPFPIYVDHAAGGRKWDVDGHEYVDLVMGHGALLLGHGRPEVVAAVQAQMAKGTHYGAASELEVRWGQLVQRLIPSAQHIRFTSSGTEATLLAMRLARAYTGKDKILKFEQHFHGWHDYATIGAFASAGAQSASGIPAATLGTVRVVPANDAALIDHVLATDPDIAGIILEPTGASMGVTPVYPEFLAELRTLATKYHVPLIFDEVVTGFRTSPGGAQARFGVTPDLTTLAKILAGGLPGGAVAGRADIVGMIAHRDGDWNATRRVAHPGTFNANPLSAAAGVAALELIATGEENRKAEAVAQQLRDGFNAVLERVGVPGCAYGVGPVLHFRLGKPCFAGLGEGPACDHTWCRLAPAEIRPGLTAQLQEALKLGMLNHGVDLLGRTAIVSSAHTSSDIERTVAAFEATVQDMAAEGLVPRR
jgi:glutamate-1-semialdehyde 2,1-aminomutase